MIPRVSELRSLSQAPFWALYRVWIVLSRSAPTRGQARQTGRREAHCLGLPHSNAFSRAKPFSKWAGLGLVGMRPRRAFRPSAFGVMSCCFLGPHLGPRTRALSLAPKPKCISINAFGLYRVMCYKSALEHSSGVHCRGLCKPSSVICL
jgi:hypothetical protein